MSALAIDDLMNAVAESAADISRDVLGKSGESGSGEQANADEDSGAYVALIGEGIALQIGFAARPDTCRSLAGTLLGLDNAEASPAGQDVADAIGEIANMLAGGVKMRLDKHFPALRVGLPLWVENAGKVRLCSGAAEVGVRMISMGGCPARAIVFRKTATGQGPEPAK